MADNVNNNTTPNNSVVVKFDSKVNSLGAVAGVISDNGDKAYDLSNLRAVALAYGLIGAIVGSKMARKNASEGRPAVGGLLF